MIDIIKSEGLSIYIVYGIAAVILAFISYILLTFAYNFLAIIVRLMVKYWIWVIVLLGVIVFIKMRRRRISIRNRGV